MDCHTLCAELPSLIGLVARAYGWALKTWEDHSLRAAPSTIPPANFPALGTPAPKFSLWPEHLQNLHYGLNSIFTFSFNLASETINKIVIQNPHLLFLKE
jgi:hypothetical protein